MATGVTVDSRGASRAAGFARTRRSRERSDLSGAAARPQVTR